MSLCLLFLMNYPKFKMSKPGHSFSVPSILFTLLRFTWPQRRPSNWTPATLSSRNWSLRLPRARQGWHEQVCPQPGWVRLTFSSRPLSWPLVLSSTSPFPSPSAFTVWTLLVRYGRWWGRASSWTCCARWGGRWVHHHRGGFTSAMEEID